MKDLKKISEIILQMSKNNIDGELRIFPPQLNHKEDPALNTFPPDIINLLFIPVAWLSQR